VLVARRADRLEELRVELASATVEVEVLAADLATDAGVTAVAARVAAPDRPIDLLVNNAGFGSHGRLWERPLADARGQIAVNVQALVALSHAAASAMVPRGRGTILNVSSIAGLLPSPGNAVYSATKAFVTNFSEGLSIELRGTGVQVSASCPGLTHTEFHAVSRPGDTAIGPEVLWMTADAVARDALDAAARGRVVRVHGAGNRALAVVSQLLPRVVKRTMVGRAMGRPT
jgi:short-subunit dehydrogenase